MKKIFFFFAFLVLSSSLFMSKSHAQNEKIDTVFTGIYITKIHDIDFRLQEYSINLWLWLKYKNKDFDFLHNLEVPQAKSVVQSFAHCDTTDGTVNILMKLQCVMNDFWEIQNFPFDRQKLLLTFENSEFDSRYLVFAIDSVGKDYDTRFTLSGWTIDSCNLAVGNKVYETNFGDTSLDKANSMYSDFKISVKIKRNNGLFLKIFIGMYLAFLIAYVCFFIHSDNIDSRFGLCVGALFAVIGNKYIIDSSLPESTSFTLVDTLHGITLLFILTAVASTAYTLQLIKENKFDNAKKFDKTISLILLFSYIILNIYFISIANIG